MYDNIMQRVAGGMQPQAGTMPQMTDEEYERWRLEQLARMQAMNTPRGPSMMVAGTPEYLRLLGQGRTAGRYEEEMAGAMSGGAEMPPRVVPQIELPPPDRYEAPPVGTINPEYEAAYLRQRAASEAAIKEARMEELRRAREERLLLEQRMREKEAAQEQRAARALEVLQRMGR